MALLLDTNVISEAAKPWPHKPVIEFLRHKPDAYLSVISLHELRHGAERVQSLNKRRRLLEWIKALRATFSKQILAVDADIAERAAILRARDARQGRILHIEDALIAATALRHHLKLVTRNTSDFETTGVGLINPWED